MKTTFARKALLSAAISAALLPIAMSASAAPDRHEGPRHAGPDMRAELYERAGIDADTREALKQAGIEHHEAIEELNADFREQRQEILGEDGMAALERAVMNCAKSASMRWSTSGSCPLKTARPSTLPGSPSRKVPRLSRPRTSRVTNSDTMHGAS